MVHRIAARLPKGLNFGFVQLGFGQKGFIRGGLIQSKANQNSARRELRACNSVTLLLRPKSGYNAH